MTVHRFYPVLGAVIWATAVFAGAAAATADTVGAVEAVKRNVYGKPPEADEAPKYVGAPVVYQETIKTLNDSAALIRFDDGSKLTVGAKSVVQLDEFVYDPQKSTGKAVLSVTGGAIRFVTGSMPKGNTTIVTPTATMVLRGTEVTVQVGPDGTTTLNVIAGQVDTVATGNKAQTTVTPGHSLHIGQTGFSHTSEQTEDGPDDDLGETTKTGDDVVDGGLGNGPTGGKGPNINTGNTSGNQGASAAGAGATSNHNAGSGHGNNGGL